VALVTRNGKTYCYLYKWHNGRAECRYRGSGDEAIMAQALADDNRRQRRAQAEIGDHHRQEYRIERARGQSLSTLVRVGLEARGFCRYSRNPWKRRTMKALPAPDLKSEAKQRLAAKRAEIREAIYNLVHRRADGAVQRLQALAREFPDVFESEVQSDVVRLARGILADKESATGGIKLRDDLLARMHLVSADFAGPDPSPARRLCADVVSFAWAEHWLLAIVVGGNRGDEQSHQASKRLQGAQQRLLSALRTHAQIERIETRRPRPAQHEAIDAVFKVIR
jgi:hypothetical protein